MEVSDGRVGMFLSSALADRVRRVAIAVPVAAIIFGAAIGATHREFMLLAPAVIFGWSQLSGA
jgi:hypothetical protein